MRPARVLYTIPNLDTAGSGHALVQLARLLDRDRFTPTICVGSRRSTRLEGEAIAAGVDVIECQVAVGARPYHSLPSRAWRAAQALDERFDLWHSFHYLDDYSEPLVARLGRARAWMYTKKNMSWGGRGWRVRSRLSNGIAMQNPEMGDLFFSHYRGPTATIPPGVDDERFHPGPAQTSHDPAPGSERPVIGNVAHIVPGKNQVLLVEALGRMRSPADLVIAGGHRDGGTVAAIERRAAELGVQERVHLPGAVSDPARFLRHCAVFAFPSEAEGCPVAVLEAMATGVPVVASDIAGTRHVFDDRSTGIRLPAHDPDRWAATLDELLEDPDRRRTLGAAARRRVARSFSADLEADRYQAFYADLLAR